MAELPTGWWIDDWDDDKEEENDFECYIDEWPGYCGGNVAFGFVCMHEKVAKDGKLLIQKIIDRSEDEHPFSTTIAADRVKGVLAEAFKWADKNPTIYHNRRWYNLQVSPRARNPNSGNWCRTLIISKAGRK